MENYLYFAEADVETGGDSASEAVTVPASSYLFADPLSLTVTNFYFKSVLGSDYGMQKVALTHTSAKNKEVIKGVLACMNAHPSKGGFVIVANANVAALTTGAEYSEALQGFVTGVAITQDVTGAVGGGTGNVYLPEMSWGGATAALSNGLALTVNTNYHSIATVVTATVPSAAAGKIGDWITVKYTTVINDGVVHTFNTTTDTTFTPGSTITRIGGGVASGIDVCDGSAKNTLVIDGDTNGDGGIGTVIRFVNTTGAANGWAAESIVLNQGDGSVAMAAATTFPA
tara:strand:- start:224 stop:1081 length:858 start_codon:yes stop_codon:yes gene_type:complete